MMKEMDIEAIARKRAGKKMGFYIHATVYVLVMTFLMAINFVTGGYPWSLAVLVFWGIAIAIHGLSVSSIAFDFKRRLVEKEIQSLKR